MRPGFSTTLPYVRNNSANPWLPDYPNPPDLRFNYFKLLNDAWTACGPIAKAPPGGKTVGIVGAGAAGMAVARELWRAGYAVRIFEASDRIGGRLYTQPLPNRSTAFEYGAMRMPFFNENGVTPNKSENCLLAYYLNRDQGWFGNPRPTYAEMSDFPNPGQATGGTGIYMNDGYGPNDCYNQPTMIPWPYKGQPENPDLQKVAAKVNAFITLFSTSVAAAYTTDGWEQLWRNIATNYDKMSFSDLVFTKAITASEYKDDGWFGGFGMTEYESSLFYTIGAGDGSWGSFYAIGAMWFIRCVMFGYSSNLQSITTLHNAPSLPFYNQRVFDSHGRSLTPPLYRGIQALCELMFYLPPPGVAKSLYQACADGEDHSAMLYVSTPVKAISNSLSGKIFIFNSVTHDPIGVDYVVVTSPIWATQLSISFNNFDRKTQFPWQVPTAMQQQHLIASCKVFFPLSRAYWQSGSKIPQIIVTDTFVQDAYGINWGASPYDAAILASYTWEDDASKLLSLDDKTVAEMVLAELETVTTSTVGESIRQYIDASGAVVFQWTMQPTYHGCAKLYRQRNWRQCYDLLAYNQTYAKASNIYFAGESYGTEGGWTEPALRTAMDAVIHLVNNSGGTFQNQFQFSDYPRYDTAFNPNENYPETAAGKAASREVADAD